MSSYNLIARSRQTHNEVEVSALDDFFGRHKYGYQIYDAILTEEEFHEQYEPVVSLEDKQEVAP
jgi:hypothetical protein